MPKFTDSQIIEIYDHFENGAPRPAYAIKNSFTATMGRRVVSDDQGTRILPI